MKITEVRCHLLTVPLPMTAVNSRLSHWTTALVEVRTDDGLSGLGEVYAGLSAPEPTKKLVELYGQLLIGEDPRRVSHLHEKMRSKCLFWGKAGLPLIVLGSIENALWDIKGKSMNTPVYELLGGRAHDRIKVYASGGLEADESSTAKEMERYLEQGYQAVKIRIWSDLAADISKLRLCRRVLGENVDLMVDAVMGHNRRPWSGKEALRRAKIMEELNIAWYEEPCGNRDYAGYAFVRAHTSVPVAGGESAVGVHEFLPFFEASALDIVQPDPAHSGGIIEVQRICNLARARGVKVALHSWGAAPCLMANYHMAFADPLSDYLEFPTHGLPLIDELAVERLKLVDGCFAAPTAPGLGVQLSERTLARYPYQPGTNFWP